MELIGGGMNRGEDGGGQNDCATVGRSSARRRVAIYADKLADSAQLIY